LPASPAPPLRWDYGQRPRLKRVEQPSDTDTKVYEGKASTRAEGGKVGVDDYADKARDFSDEQGGMEGMEDEAQGLRDAAGGEGDTGDRARDAVDEFRNQDDEDQDEEEFDR
jgi:hypothetical protein